MKGIDAFLRMGFWGIAIASVLASVVSAQTVTTGILRDEGGAVFNVKAYGATGNGTTNDSPYIQLAINAAVSAGGGVVYIPAGTYLISTTLSNSRADLVSIVGSGMGSKLNVNTTVGLSLPAISGGGLSNGGHRGSIEHLWLACASLAADTAVQMTDMIVAPSLTDLAVSNCNVGFDLVNTNDWTERLVATNINDYYNNHLFHYDQNPTDSANSYGYGIYNGIYVNKQASQDVFWLTGGAYIYHSTFTVKGNFTSSATGAAIFNVQGASGQPCPGAAENTYDIAVEGGEYSVVIAANNGCSSGATGNTLVQGIGPISAIGVLAATTNFILNSGGLPYLLGILTTTAGSSDTLTVSGPSPSFDCYVTPKNSIAASMGSSTYVSGTNWGSVTVAHPATAGGVFQVWCSGQ